FRVKKYFETKKHLFFSSSTNLSDEPKILSRKERKEMEGGSGVSVNNSRKVREVRKVLKITLDILACKYSSLGYSFAARNRY
ncbi:MAG: hypothetical protein IJH67_11760, partial [Thermoguttaceae bacterium]|nr:hypothetical protein [Thermoguttaceae bacterium]